MIAKSIAGQLVHLEHEPADCRLHGLDGTNLLNNSMEIGSTKHYNRRPELDDLPAIPQSPLCIGRLKYLPLLCQCSIHIPLA